jgi:hypothetical protein
MAIFLDNNVTHGETDIGGNTTTPPGITGPDWCHAISDVSLQELTDFLDGNPGIGQVSTNIRTPDLGSQITYVGLDPDMRDAAVLAGATAMGRVWTLSHSFDADASKGAYEP